MSDTGLLSQSGNENGVGLYFPCCARINGVNACSSRGKTTVLLTNRISEKCWLSYPLIEDNVN